MSAPRRSLTAGARAVLAAPYLWLLLFFAAPFALVVKISLSQQVDARPPYAPSFDWGASHVEMVEQVKLFTLEAYRTLLSDWLYVEAYLSSLKIAALATALTLLVAYPLAYAMARAPRRWRMTLLVLAVAPFWTSFLVRVYAWMALLKDDGLINAALMKLGLIAQPLAMFATTGAVLVGIVYSYLPFMVLPLYNALEKQDANLVEAAMDLGATRLCAFWRVTAPLSLRGVIAGSLLVFIPAVGEFVIPDLLGPSDMLMIGRTLWDEFFNGRNWPLASAAAIVLLALLVAPLAFFERAQARRAS